MQMTMDDNARGCHVRMSCWAAVIVVTFQLGCSFSRNPAEALQVEQSDRTAFYVPNRHPGVEALELDLRERAIRDLIEIDSTPEASTSKRLPQPWYIAFGQTYEKLINPPEGYSKRFDGSGIKIAIIAEAPFDDSNFYLRSKEAGTIVSVTLHDWLDEKTAALEIDINPSGSSIGSGPSFGMIVLRIYEFKNGTWHFKEEVRKSDSSINPWTTEGVLGNPDQPGSR